MYGGGHGTSVIRAPLYSKYLRPHAVFCAEKSVCSKTTATVGSNLAHLCNIPLVETVQACASRPTYIYSITVMSVALATKF